MQEFDKLEQYLREKAIPYKRVDEPFLGTNDDRFYRHQLIVFDDNENRLWDAIYQFGSYGFKDGLLEICGSLVKESDGGEVVGWLKAQDVIKRIEEVES